MYRICSNGTRVEHKFCDVAGEALQSLMPAPVFRQVRAFRRIFTSNGATPPLEKRDPVLVENHGRKTTGFE